MTDTEYFLKQLALAETEAGNWRAAERDALTPDRIQYCQERVAAAQARIDVICAKLDGIKRCMRMEDGPVPG
jgi:hypothetical protein